MFDEKENLDNETLNGFIELMFEPALKSIEEMIYKEEKILLPMCVDTFTDIEWYQIDRQSDDIGFCIYFPEKRWEPNFETKENEKRDDAKVRVSTGALKPEELEAMMNSIPLDLTFVDKDDKVRYFSHGKDRVFQRSKAILGREVQYCHPPSSVHIVNQILDDFKTGKQDAAKFWIDFHGKYVHISYYAVRDNEGKYLGTVELTQDIKEFRELEGERRILQYDN
ncbi:MAG: PAS domain-containing protein [Melioribacteraceae bacterium]|nr:PAS domain-containing protein [Melioribacteraceae bacterium]